jgi:hypothetical protein
MKADKVGLLMRANVLLCFVKLIDVLVVAYKEMASVGKRRHISSRR